MSLRCLLVLALSLALALPAVAAGATRYVTKTGSDADDCLTATPQGGGVGPCLTIQHVVGLADDGDTIDVGPGTYAEQVSVSDRITIRGAGAGPVGAPNPSLHTIVAPASGFGARMFGGGVLQGLRVQAGDTPTLGMGLYLSATAPGPALTYALRDVVLAGAENGTSSSPALIIEPGPGSREVRAEATDAVFAGSQIAANTTPTIHVNGLGAVLQADRSTISGGSGTSDRGVTLDGGGVAVLNDSRAGADASLASALFVNGSGTFHVNRSLIVGPTPLVLNPTVAGQQAAAAVRGSVVRPAPGTPGAAIVALASNGAVATVDVRQSTLIGNNNGVGTLSALGVDGGTTSIDIGNTVVRNVVPGWKELYAGTGGAGGSSASIVAQHSSYTTAAVMGGGTATSPGTGTNVTGDPGFVDLATMNLRLRPDSSGVDRGTPALLDAGETDADGAARPVDGNDDCVVLPDIGAYELQGHAAACPPPSGGDAPVPPPAASPVAASLPRAPARPVVSGLRLRLRSTELRATFRLSTAAPVALKLERQLPGLRRGRTCARPTAALRRRRARRCTRLKPVATVRIAGRAGANTLLLRRRLGKGRYRATLTVTGAAKAVSGGLTVPR